MLTKTTTKMKNLCCGECLMTQQPYRNASLRRKVVFCYWYWSNTWKPYTVLQIRKYKIIRCCSAFTCSNCLYHVCCVCSKIALYSPETAKQYEKSLSRKNNSKFHPKAALQKLKSKANVSQDVSLTDREKRELIAEYLEVKYAPFRHRPLRRLVANVIMCSRFTVQAVDYIVRSRRRGWRGWW